MAFSEPQELHRLLGKDGMRRFLRVYLSETQRRLHDLREGANAGQTRRIRDALHALLPASRWAGADEVAELCEALHRRADLDAFTPEHARLAEEIVRRHAVWERALYEAMPEILVSPPVTAPDRVV